MDNRLCERAILIRVKEHMKGIYKIDNKARNDLADKAKGDNGAFYVMKYRYPKVSLEEMRACISKAKALHRKYTLPWSDTGDRLLPNSQFLNFVGEFNVIKNEFNNAKEHFRENFELYKQNGLANMGEYADTTLYPKDASGIDNLFMLDISLRSCPEINDIRVDIPQLMLDELRLNEEQKIQNNLNNAVKDVWGRLHGVLSHLSKVLDMDPKFARKSVLSNIEDIIHIIPSYNLTDDKELEERKKETEDILKNIKSLDDLKDNDQLRRNTVIKINDLLNKFPEL